VGINALKYVKRTLKDIGPSFMDNRQKYCEAVVTKPKTTAVISVYFDTIKDSPEAVIATAKKTIVPRQPTMLKKRVSLFVSIRFLPK
jgi:hypothetical protein